MLHPPGCHALEEKRTRLTGPKHLDRPVNLLMDLNRIVVFNSFCRDPVRGGSPTAVEPGLPISLMRVDCEGIVFTDENNGRLLQRRKIEALVECAFIARSITEEV